MSELFPAKVIAIEVISCTDPDREAEFNWWYDKVQIPIIRQIPGIQSVHRYGDMRPNLNEKEFGANATRYDWPKERGNRYLTLYRLYSNNPWAMMQEFKEDDKKRAQQGKIIDCAKSWELTVWDFYACRKSLVPQERRQGLATNLPDGMPEVILTVPGSWGANHASKKGQDDWWLYTHSHDLCEYRGLMQANRYHSLNPEPAEDEPTGLNFYEIDHDDPVALLTQVVKDDRDIRRPSGRMSGWRPPGVPVPQVVSHLGGLYRHWDMMSANFI